MAEVGVLYIVATPIGNLQDITLRALTTLKNADVILCEERRQGSTLLKRLEIPYQELLQVNEHNEKQMQEEVLRLLAVGKTVALISDCGTPVFADPGAHIIEMACQAGFLVVPIPGASSLMAALSMLDFKAEQFYFAGFLPRVETERLSTLAYLKTLKTAIVILDTPYRLSRLLLDVSRAFGENQRVTLAYNITLADETFYRDAVKNVLKQVAGKKGEFVLIIHPPRG